MSNRTATINNSGDKYVVCITENGKVVHAGHVYSAGAAAAHAYSLGATDVKWTSDQR